MIYILKKDSVNFKKNKVCRRIDTKEWHFKGGNKKYTAFVAVLIIVDRLNTFAILNKTTSKNYFNSALFSIRLILTLVFQVYKLLKLP
jgi:hypothetical protein